MGPIRNLVEGPHTLQEESLSIWEVKENGMATLSLQLPDTIIHAISTIPFVNNLELQDSSAWAFSYNDSFSLRCGCKFSFYFAQKNLFFLFYTSNFTKHPHQSIYSTHLFNKIFILLLVFIIFFTYFLYCLSLHLKPNHHHHHYCLLTPKCRRSQQYNSRSTEVEPQGVR